MAIKDNIPGFIYVCFKEIYDCFEDSFYRLDNLEKEVVDNAHIERATWALEQLEEIYGIEHCPEDDYDIRRSRILAKKRGATECTIDAIKKIVEAYIGEDGKDVEVIDNGYESDYFIVKFGTRMKAPPKLKDFYRSLCEIKPAHMEVQVLFQQVTWRDVLSKGNWSNVNNNGTKEVTWDEILNFE